MTKIVTLLLTFMLLTSKFYAQGNFKLPYKKYEIRATLVTLSFATLRINVSQGNTFFLRILMNREKLEIEIEGKGFTEQITGKSISDAKKSFTESVASAIKKSKLTLSPDANYIARQIVKLLDSHPLNSKSEKFLWEQVTKLDEIPIFL